MIWSSILLVPNNQLSIMSKIFNTSRWKSSQDQAGNSDNTAKDDHHQVPSSSSSSSPQQRNSYFQSYLSPVDKYCLEWTDLSTICEDARLTHLRTIAVSGHLKVSKFRSIAWAALLNILEGNSQAWAAQRRTHRAHYQHLKVQHNANPRCEPAAAAAAGLQDDPLSQSNQSAWNQHFCDQELFAVIRQDVIRTFPGVDFYRRPAVQELMINVLFCYAREHPSMCYRQGMHEILAPILFVMHCDQQTYLHIRDICESGDVFQVLGVVLDPNHMEEDAYFIFAKIMDAIESYYRINDMTPSPTGYFPPSQSCTMPGDDQRSKLEVVGQLNSIRDRILTKVDSQLHQHLLKLDIPLTLFGIRWLRLLFGREFSLPDLLVVWDAIFAAGRHFQLTNYIVVAMLTQIRQTLLSSDYTTCLTHLMKYPSNVDVTLIIRYALHIKEPHLYACPPGAQVQQPSPIVSRIHKDSLPVKIVPTSRAVEEPSANHRRAQSHEETSHNYQRKRSGSLATGKQTTVDEERRRSQNVRLLQNTTALAAMRLNPTTGSIEHDPSIVEGFREDSAEVLRIELESARAIMSITRLKLTQYLSVLRQNIPGQTMDALHQSMDGIEELCSLLQVKPSHGLNNALPVERAFEVNEPPPAGSTISQRSSTSSISSESTKTSSRSHQPTPPSLTITTTTPTKHSSSSNETTPPPPNRTYRRSEGDDARRSFVQQVQRADNCDFEFVVSPSGVLDPLAYDEIIYTSPALDAGARLDAMNGESAPTNGYEIPDDGRFMSRKATKILGDRKEVEMHEFNSRLAARQAVHVGDANVCAGPMVDPPCERDSPDELH